MPTHLTEQDVKAAFERSIEHITGVFDRYPWENKEAYCLFLSQTYYLVRHTTRFLSLSAARTPIDQRDLHYSFLKHLKEELHHDIPLSKDMQFFGKSPKDYQELPEMRLIRNDQYYWIENGGPHAPLGYSLFLEGLSAIKIPDLLKRLDAVGFTKATTFLKLHAEVDQGHFEGGLTQLKSCPQDGLHEVMANLEESTFLYGSMFERMKMMAAGPKSKAA